MESIEPKFISSETSLSSLGREVVINTVKKWLSEIYSPTELEKAFVIQEKYSSEKELYLLMKIFTSVNEYSIAVSIDENHSYLGGSAISRKPRTGEDWNRGNDLSDGRFCEETWRNILKDIVKYETEQIKSEKWKEKHKTEHDKNLLSIPEGNKDV